MAPAPRLILVGLSVVAIIAVSAVYVPVIMDSPNQNETTTLTLQQDISQSVIGDLQTSLDTVDTAQDSVNVSVYNLQTSDTGNLTLTKGDTKNLTFTGETISVTLVEILSGDRAVLSYTYPPTVTYTGGEKKVINDLLLVFVGVVVTIIAGFAFLAFKSITE